MIKRIRIRNFKSLKDVTVDLSSFNVLIGQNGAGKSSFLQAMQMLSWLIRHRSINDTLESQGLTYNELVYLRASSSHMFWDLDLTVKDPATMKDLNVHFEIALAKRKHVYVTSEVIVPEELFTGHPIEELRFAVGRKGRSLMVASEENRIIHYRNVSLPHSILLDARVQKNNFPILSTIADELAGFVHYEIWGPEFLRRASTGRATTLAERGQNLPSVLRTLRNRNPEGYNQLLEEVRQAYPWFDSIKIRKLGGRHYGLSFLERQAKDKRKRRVQYEPSQVSDGFLRLLALTTLKFQPGTVKVLGYEEPENGMHPGMIRASVEKLRDVAKKGTQVIVTTHSPFMLQDLLSEEFHGDPLNELRLVWRDGGGKTVIRPPNTDMLRKASVQGIGIGEVWSMLLDEPEMAAPSVENEGR